MCPSEDQYMFDVRPSEGTVPTKAQWALRSVTLVVPVGFDRQFLPRMVEVLEENSCGRPPSVIVHQDLVCIVSHRVHVLLETNDSALCLHVFVFVEPDLHTISLLEAVEYLVDVQGHNLLQLHVVSNATSVT